jgi:Raf kinase inhibitor-like YbhB/YbcL family protein
VVESVTFSSSPHERKRTMKHFFIVMTLAFACGQSGTGQPTSMPDSGSSEPSVPSFQLTSMTLGQDFSAAQFWNSFGCTGNNASPDLSWSGFPADTKSFAITLFDQDAPTGSGFWHWVAYNVPANVTALAAGAISSKQFPQGLTEGNTDLGQPGYFGPCPPVGRKHRYVFTVYALKVETLDIPAGATAAFVSFNLWQNTLARATLSATAGPR